MFLRGVGAGALERYTSAATGRRPWALTAVDINGDRLLDVIAPNADSSFVSVVLQRPDRTFSNGTPSSGSVFCCGGDSIDLGDIDGDGLVDAAVGRQAYVDILVGDGKGHLAQGAQLRAGTATDSGRVVDVAVTELNGDEILEIVAADGRNGEIVVFLGLGNLQFTAPVRYPTGAAASQPSQLAVADLDLDGHIDVATANAGTDEVTVFLGQADGTLSLPLHFDVGDEPRGLAVGDLNQDGIPDIVTANAGAGTISILLGGGDPPPPRSPTQTLTITPTPTVTSSPTITLSPTATPSPTPSPSGTPTRTPPATLTRTPTAPSVPRCPGDCDDSDDVTIEELMTAVGTALGELHALECADADGDGRVTVVDIHRAINNALHGCPPPSPEPDAIDALVAQVSVDRIQQHIAALAGVRRLRPDQLRAADYIERVLQSYGYEVRRLPSLFSDTLAVSHLGTEQPGRALILGAHYDTVAVSPGADDNASGVAALLEIARLLASVQTRLTVELAAFADEEIGFLGSFDYAFDNRARSDEIAAMFSLDMIAYTCTRPGCQFAFPNIPDCLQVSQENVDVGTFIAAVANQASAAALSAFETAATRYVPDLFVGSATVAGTGQCLPSTRNSDHVHYWDLGYPALLITDTANFRNPNYHLPTDTLDTLDLGFAHRVTQAVLAAAASIAQLDHGR